MENHFVWWIKVSTKEKDHPFSTMPPAVVFLNYEDAKEELLSLVDHYKKTRAVMKKDPSLDDLYRGSDPETGDLIHLCVYGSLIVKERRSK